MLDYRSVIIQQQKKLPPMKIPLYWLVDNTNQVVCCSQPLLWAASKATLGFFYEMADLTNMICALNLMIYIDNPRTKKKTKN